MSPSSRSLPPSRAFNPLREKAKEAAAAAAAARKGLPAGTVGVEGPSASFFRRRYTQRAHLAAFCQSIPRSELPLVRDHVCIESGSSSLLKSFIPKAYTGILRPRKNVNGFCCE